MPDTALYTYEAAVAKANVILPSLATSKLRMFKNGLTVNAQTTRAVLLTNECDFDGYTSGGYAIAAFTGPYRSPGGGASISTPLVVSEYGPAGTPPVTNEVGGYWIEDATAPDPLVREVVVFNPFRLMGQVGDVIQVINTITEGLNTV